MAAIQGAIAGIRAEQARFTKALDGGALELALTELNRQVQDGNTDFVQRFVADRPDALEDALGPWVTMGLGRPRRSSWRTPTTAGTWSGRADATRHGRVAGRGSPPVPDRDREPPADPRLPDSARPGLPAGSSSRIRSGRCRSAASTCTCRTL